MITHGVQDHGSVPRRPRLVVVGRSRILHDRTVVPVDPFDGHRVAVVAARVGHLPRRHVVRVVATKGWDQRAFGDEDATEAASLGVGASELPRRSDGALLEDFNPTSPLDHGETEVKKEVSFREIDWETSLRRLTAGRQSGHEGRPSRARCS